MWGLNEIVTNLKEVIEINPVNWWSSILGLESDHRSASQNTEKKTMAAMEGVVQNQAQQPQPQQQQQQVQQQPVIVERLNEAVLQQLNLEAVKTRALSLFKAISRIIEDFDAYARTNTTPKWFPFFLVLCSTIFNSDNFEFRLGKSVI